MYKKFILMNLGIITLHRCTQWQNHCRTKWTISCQHKITLTCSKHAVYSSRVITTELYVCELPTALHSDPHVSLSNKLTTHITMNVHSHTNSSILNFFSVPAPISELHDD